MTRRDRLFLFLAASITGALAACGGSSSETPMPLEPVPHREEPSRQVAPSAEGEGESPTNAEAPKANSAESSAPSAAPADTAPPPAY